MIEVELSKIIANIETIKKFNKLKLPALASFISSKISLQIEKELQEYQKVSLEKAKEYGIQTDEEKEKNIYHFKGDNLTKFNEEMQELSQQKIKFDYDKIKITERFPEVEPEILIQLDWLFE